MKFFSKITCFFVALFILSAMFVLPSAAADIDVYEKLYDNKGGVMSISHRGDTVSYPENSLEAVLSACNKGADMISVSVRLSKDGELILAESGDLSSFCKTYYKDASQLTAKELQKISLYETDASVSGCKVATLEEVLKKLKGKSLLILDNSWEYRNEILSFCTENEAEDKVIIRTDASSKEIALWLSETGAKVAVIGIYDGAIIWSANSHLTTLSESGQPAVQYQSKNYFNEMYQNFTSKRYSSAENARAVAPMYDKDLCGQREDNETGWDEMINRGFSVIETNCIEGLENYISESEKCLNDLEALIEKGERVDKSLYSTVSANNFSDALKNAKQASENKNTSLGVLRESYSKLAETMKNLTFGGFEDTQRGNLNVTAGKVAAVIIFGSLLLAGEIYVCKMGAGRKKKSGSKKQIIG